MKVAQAGRELIIRLEPGDDILAAVAAACRQHHITNAEITGLGSAEAVTLAHYRRDTKKFTHRTFAGIYEIASLVGNVALIDGQTAAHCHVVISGPDMAAHAGHLAAGVCSATVELVVRPLDGRYEKRHDEIIGLNLWQL